MFQAPGRHPHAASACMRAPGPAVGPVMLVGSLPPSTGGIDMELP